MRHHAAIDLVFEYFEIVRHMACVIAFVVEMGQVSVLLVVTVRLK